MRNIFFWIHMYHTSTSHPKNTQKTIHFQNLPEIFVALRGNPIPPCRPRRTAWALLAVVAEAVGSGASTARWNRWRGSKRPDHRVPELADDHYNDNFTQYPI